MFSFASRARGETSPYCLAESLESTRTVSIRFVQDHRVRSTDPRSSLFSPVVFMFDIANIEIHTWIEYNKYHEEKSRFDEILEF